MKANCEMLCFYFGCTGWAMGSPFGKQYLRNPRATARSMDQLFALFSWRFFPMMLMISWMVPHNGHNHDGDGGDGHNEDKEHNNEMGDVQRRNKDDGRDHGEVTSDGDNNGNGALVERSALMVTSSPVLSVGTAAAAVAN
mmetsp:Transcript_6357/g.14009  ORF Transcript_6357/g.14009 Transcript_6357/m.14009 type:complete len:140 (-) Transcript_6357:163-582(-)